MNSERVFGAIDREKYQFHAYYMLPLNTSGLKIGIGDWGLGIGDGIGKETFYATLVRFKRMELSLKIGSW